MTPVATLLTLAKVSQKMVPYFKMMMLVVISQMRRKTPKVMLVTSDARHICCVGYEMPLLHSQHLGDAHALQFAIASFQADLPYRATVTTKTKTQHMVFTDVAYGGNAHRTCIMSAQQDDSSALCITAPKLGERQMMAQVSSAL